MEWKQRLESLKVCQAKAAGAQRQQLEAQMRCSLGMLEEQAANHVKSIQQKYTIAQTNASAMDKECTTLKKRCDCACTCGILAELQRFHVQHVLEIRTRLAVVAAHRCKQKSRVRIESIACACCRVADMEEQVECISNAKNTAQIQWEAKESQLYAAFEEERKAHEGIIRELHEKHDMICQKHSEALHKVEAVRSNATMIHWTLSAHSCKYDRQHVHTECRTYSLPLQRAKMICKCTRRKQQMLKRPR